METEPERQNDIIKPGRRVRPKRLSGSKGKSGSKSRRSDHNSNEAVTSHPFIITDPEPMVARINPGLLLWLARKDCASGAPSCITYTMVANGDADVEVQRD